MRQKANPIDIKQSRHNAGLTQTQAADVIDYSRRAWAEWEGGGRKMEQKLLDEFNNSVNNQT